MLITLNKKNQITSRHSATNLEEWFVRSVKAVSLSNLTGYKNATGFLPWVSFPTESRNEVPQMPIRFLLSKVKVKSPVGITVRSKCDSNQFPPRHGVAQNISELFNASLNLTVTTWHFVILNIAAVVCAMIGTMYNQIVRKVV